LIIRFSIVYLKLGQVFGGIAHRVIDFESSVGPSSVNLSDNSKNSAHKGSLMIGSYIRYSINYISFGLVSDEASCLKAVSIF